MEKRIFIAVLISLGLMWGWSAVIAPKYFPEYVKQPASTSSQSTTTTNTSSSSGITSTTSTVARTTTGTVAKGVAPAVAGSAPIADVSAPAVVYSRIETPDFIARFSNRGAQLVSFQLLKYKAKDGSPVELIKARDANRTDFPFSIQAGDPNVTRELNSGLYTVSDRTEDGIRVLEYHYASNGVAMTKTFRIGNEYMFHFAVAATPAVPYRVAIGPDLRTLDPDERDSRVVVTGSGVVQHNDKLEVILRDKASGIQTFDNVQFVGLDDNYFLSVLRPDHGGEAVLRRIDVPLPTKEIRHEIYAAVNAAPDGAVSGTAFFGPKQAKLLDRYGLDKTLQFGMFGIIGRFFLLALIWLNQFTKNFGFAIIVLTILIKIVLYPLQHKSITSMKKMQKLAPKQEAIKAKYKKARTDPAQRAKMNEEVMKLYQQEGINPMGGCLPMVLQLPILWGFYGLLSRAIELRGAPFILWIHDLSAKDPYYITPLLMTITMFIQQMMTPTTGDQAQRRMFLILPLVFGWIFKEFAAGLVLYWLVQNVLTIIQQAIMNKYWKDHPTELQTTT